MTKFSTHARTSMALDRPLVRAWPPRRASCRPDDTRQGWFVGAGPSGSRSSRRPAGRRSRACDRASAPESREVSSPVSTSSPARGTPTQGPLRIRYDRTSSMFRNKFFCRLIRRSTPEAAPAISIPALSTWHPFERNTIEARFVANGHYINHEKVTINVT